MPLLYLHGSLCRESAVSIVMDTYFLTVKSDLRLLGTPSPLLCVNSPCKTKVRRGGDGCGLYHAIKMLIQSQSQPCCNMTYKSGFLDLFIKGSFVEVRGQILNIWFKTAQSIALKS